MIQFLHDPTISKVQVSFGAAFAGFMFLWTLVGRIRWEQRHEISGPEMFQKEMYAEDDIEEIVAEGALPVRVITRTSPILTPRRVSIAGICVALIGGGIWFGARNYIIIRCWDRGEVSVGNKDYRGAEEVYRKAVRIDPVSPESHLLLATALLRQHETEKAIPELRLAAQSDRGDADVHVTLGDALQTVGKPEEAIPEYEYAIAIAPKSADSYTRLGSALVKVNRNGDAIKEFQYSILLDPKNVKACANLGYALMIQGDVEGGLSKLKRCVDLAPDDVAAHNELGNVYVQTARYAEAAAEYRAAVAINPEFAVAYFNLGVALMNCNNTGGAIEAYESYLRKCANNPDARIAVPQAIKYLKRLQSKLNAVRPVRGGRR